MYVFSEQELVHYRKDYTPPTHLIDKTDLVFDIFTEQTTVIARLLLKRNPNSKASDSIFLHGKAKLVSLRLNEKEIQNNDYEIQDEGLLIKQVPENFILEITTEINPKTNTSLMGLYASNGNLFTQCEPEGFRQISYYLDRPDVMSCFSTTIIASQNDYPVLLSNGNKISFGSTNNNRHWVKWVDPYRKPAYLFALVAGKLVSTDDTFISKSGRNVLLQVWTEKSDQARTQHAINSIQRAMRWDEERFGLEYDLDIFMIVAVSDFNMGAMENKGLNIFNTQYVLADQETATDDNFVGVESVIGHEYFHNWTGNRVTCRDWFQLSLKEGLTVFRDQEFSSDMRGSVVQRIEDVKRLRALQFPEDASPTSHPIRPDSYIEMNNFYTATVYEKGAEVVRMYLTLLGKEGFDKGMRLYFERHDGQAVTCDDFLAAMADANHADLTQFALWYQQSGTPSLKISSQYNPVTQEFTLLINQRADDKSTVKTPLHIPCKIGLIAQDGSDMPLQLKGSDLPMQTSYVLNLRQEQEAFTFVNIAEEPTPSLLRGFSAPVHLEYNFSEQQLIFLMMHDSDAFCRWEAGQSLLKIAIIKLYAEAKKQQNLDLSENLIKAFKAVLLDVSIDPEFKTLMLTLPTENQILEWLEEADPRLICLVRDFILHQLAQNLHQEWQQTFDKLSVNNNQISDAGLRALKNLALYMLNQIKDESALDAAYKQYVSSDNMTDQIGALLALNANDSKQRDACLGMFAKHWHNNMLVMDKYFSLIASSHLTHTLEQVHAAIKHPTFNLKNPNKVRALIGTFAKNMRAFHAADGSGYSFVAQSVRKIDQFNPQVASRLAQTFNRWRKLDLSRQNLVINELKNLLSLPELSKDVREIVSKLITE